MQTLPVAEQRERITSLIREKRSRELVNPIAVHLGSSEVELRGSLAMSQIVGPTVARHVIGLEALESA